ncbi:hypothetical protein ACFXBB_33590 [Streptomyces scopuliridis]|uniref:hypothetical protein n=1 Tax=Streptomyces scopuliridis TaxID=452529 RepID=UPI0036865037
MRTLPTCADTSRSPARTGQGQHAPGSSQERQIDHLSIHAYRGTVAVAPCPAGVSQHVMANLGRDRVRLPNPVFEGDTLYSQS